MNPETSLKYTNLNFNIQKKIFHINFFINKLNIPIETSFKPLNVELWLPIEKHCEFTDSAHMKQNIPKFERSISGRRAHANLRCNYLTPLKMSITLPESYPSENEPIYTLQSIWLNKFQLNKLCAKLDEIWKENFNLPVLFTWFESIKTNLVEYLELFEQENNKLICMPLKLDIDFEEGEIELLKTSTQNNETRAHCTFNDSDSFIYEFLRHNYIEELREFNSSMQTCMICFDEKLGTEFFRLNECKHIFCVECMISMCQMHVKEGTIQLLK
jgi:hypothetical protein